MADLTDRDDTLREPMASQAILEARDSWLASKHRTPKSIAADRGCVYCGGDTLASQVRRLRWLCGGVLGLQFGIVALQIVDLMR